MNQGLAGFVLLLLGAACSSQPAPSACQIGGTLYPGGTRNPADANQICEPSKDPKAWSAADSVANIPDAGEDAGASAQAPTCLIDGDVIANRAYKPGDTSLCCNAAQNPGGWSASFINSGTFVTISPYGLVTADFDVDGRPDLALASGGTTLTLSMNQGQAQFSTVSQPTQFPVGTLQVGDFNGDGRPDLALGGSGSIGLLLNLDAGFAETDYAASGSVARIAAVDVDGDGHLDLVATNGGNSVSIFMGDGLGGLGPEVTYTTGGLSSCFVVAGLFDGDRFPDLVINECGGGAVILTNDGTGKFPTSAAIPGIGTTWALSTGHFAGPTLLDLVVGSEANPETTIFADPADAGFASQAQYATVPPADYAVGDLNGDGFDDLVAIAWYGKTFELRINRGDGTFLPGVQFTASTTDTMQTLAAADFNGDGALDIAVVPSNATSGTIWLNGCP
jgi:hypothetical protein